MLLCVFTVANIAVLVPHRRGAVAFRSARPARAEPLTGEADMRGPGN
jgi:hypothetical protein